MILTMILDRNQNFLDDTPGHDGRPDMTFAVDWA